MFVLVGESWAGVTFKLALAAAMTGLVAWWSRRATWGTAHRLAVAGSAAHLRLAGAVVLLVVAIGRAGAVRTAEAGAAE
ncbi:MAG TPA: hypothetical protein VKF14_04495 [Candidatus Dormibacteraeota bacterium]|nr:hypothetical protein [Candidatus Dormibacteraeota bacterium]